jgi:tetratricopeptide (TPR) repeat protein
MKSILLLGCVIIAVLTQPVAAASFAKAEILNENGLLHEAKIELIDVIFSNAVDAEKTKSYQLLGAINYSDGKITPALAAWRTLVQKYPSSKEALFVKDKIKELAEAAGESAKENIDNAVAQSYLRSGDFWSKGKSYKFTIDSSWIPQVETAIEWYDRTVKEFPGSTAARVAYEEKMRTLLGWKEIGRDGESYGLSKSFSYMPLLLETFASYEKEFPTASSMQAFRFQIAQAYWDNKKWDKTREWLNLIVEKSGENQSFYKDAALKRLRKIEY